MYLDKFEEHLRDSAPDNSRWDGFDRGTLWEDEDLGPDLIAEATTRTGVRIAIWNDGSCGYAVEVGDELAWFDTEALARQAARRAWNANRHHA